MQRFGNFEIFFTMYICAVSATSGRLTGSMAEDKARPKAGVFELDFGHYSFCHCVGFFTIFCVRRL